MNQKYDRTEPECMELESVMETYQASLLRYAARILNNESAAQDVVQDTFIRLDTRLQQIMKRGHSVKGWLFRTAHNAAVDYIRKESRRRALHDRFAKQPEPDPPDAASAQDRHALVLQHLHVLKPKERQVLLLRLQEEMSYREIAEVLQRSEGYVGTLIHSATQKLTQSLKQAGVIS